MRRYLLRPAAIASAVSLLSACAGFSPDGGMSAVRDIAEPELRKDVVAIRNEDDAANARATVKKLLRRPLTPDSAVQVALLNNRGLQATYNELGIAEALRVQASLPPAPTVSLENISVGGEIEIERRIIANILSLLTLPVRADIATDRFRQAQLRTARETLRVAMEARAAWYQAVASAQVAGFFGETNAAAQTASKLTVRLGESGALNKLDQARQHAFYAESTAQLAAARQRAGQDRERLIRALGLWGDTLSFRLPAALPALPRQPVVFPAIEREATRRRLDVQIAKLEIEALAKSYGMTQATRLVDVFELTGISQSKKAGGETERGRGFEAELRVPIFDFGETRVRAAEQTYMQAVNRLAETAVNARSQARDAYRSYRASYDIALHYQREILPLRQIISEEMLLRYNAMQIDVFPLLTEARQRTASNTAAIEAQHNFWLASIALSATVVGGGSASAISAPGLAMTSGGGETAGH